MTTPLSIVESHPGIWRGSQQQFPACEKKATGYPTLDQALLGGLPSKGVIRLRTKTGGGEISWLSPLLAKGKSYHLVMFINPPGHIHSPWLEEMGVTATQVRIVNTTPELALWAAEECAKASCCSFIFVWPQRLQPKQARRLQVSAAQHHTLIILLEKLGQPTESLPIPLDMTLRCVQHGVEFDITKQQGGWPVSGVTIDFHHTPDNAPINRAMKQYRSRKSSAIQVS